MTLGFARNTVGLNDLKFYVFSLVFTAIMPLKTGGFLRRLKFKISRSEWECFVCVVVSFFQDLGTFYKIKQLDTWMCGDIGVMSFFISATVVFILFNNVVIKGDLRVQFIKDFKCTISIVIGTLTIMFWCDYYIFYFFFKEVVRTKIWVILYFAGASVTLPFLTRMFKGKNVNVVRKFFHLYIFVVFMPALYMDSEAVVLCVKVGCCGLALLEVSCLD